MLGNIYTLHIEKKSKQYERAYGEKSLSLFWTPVSQIPSPEITTATMVTEFLYIFP